MWKNYSASYIKHNRASSRSILSAALACAMFLSLICSLAYNFWAYDVERILAEEGGWQGRMVCETFNTDDLSAARQFANVKKAVINRHLSNNEETTVDFYFHNPRRIYRDMPSITELLGQSKASVQYNSLLLSRYLIRDPEDETPPMLLELYSGILILAAASLVLMIRGSFELSMHARIRQFGIFSSIGATPRQIRICLLQEAAVLSALPVLIGSISGIFICRGILGAVNFYAADVPGRRDASFAYPPSLFAATVILSFLTVMISAWMPARKLSKMTPLEAIRTAGGPALRKKKHSRFLALLFGIKGELAGNAWKARKKSLRISSVSLTLSFLGFSIMLCFAALADISTEYTYFERYRDAWDVMITVKDADISDFRFIEKLREIPGMRDVAVYQKAESTVFLPEELQSDELASCGGLEAVARTQKEDGRFQVPAPIIILDDASFLNFCSQIKITPSLDGAVVLNQIWDSANSNFRYKEYVPFIKEDSRASALYKDEKCVEIPVLAYTRKVPKLREEYENYSLVHFVPLTAWKGALQEAGEAGNDSYIRAFSSKSAGLADLNCLEQEIDRLVPRQYERKSENRAQEKLSNDRLIQGMVTILGAFCVLLAMIGITNVFSNTLGFVRQREREFARYVSIGLTPREMRAIFCIEAFVIAGKPLLITLPLTALFVQFAVTASYLDPRAFWSRAPVLPILIFAAAIALFVALAYYVGGKRLLQRDLNETLQNDALI